MSRETEVEELPECDICDDGTKAKYDAKTVMGWAYLCQHHFAKFGAGLGTGKGQELVVKDERTV